MRYLLVSIFLIFSCTTRPTPPTPPTPPSPPDPKPPAPPEKHCLLGTIESISPDKPGPFRVSDSRSGRINLYLPSNLPKGCKVPMVHLSNGTGARCSIYRSVTRHLASHGFAVACYESTQTGSGRPCMAAYKHLAGLGFVDSSRIGSTGHSQGGGAAFTCQYLAEQEWPNSVTASVGIQPAHGMNRRSYVREYPSIKGAAFGFSGSRDTLVSAAWVASGMRLIRSEKYNYQAVGATHFNPYRWASSSGAAFFRWKLLGDTKAKDFFLSLASSQYWKKM